MPGRTGAGLERCLGNVGLYVYRQCHRMTYQRVGGRPFCWQHRHQANL